MATAASGSQTPAGATLNPDPGARSSEEPTPREETTEPRSFFYSRSARLPHAASRERRMRAAAEERQRQLLRGRHSQNAASVPRAAALVCSRPRINSAATRSCASKQRRHRPPPPSAGARSSARPHAAREPQAGPLGSWAPSRCSQHTKNRRPNRQQASLVRRGRAASGADEAGGCCRRPEGLSLTWLVNDSRAARAPRSRRR